MSEILLLPGKDSQPNKRYYPNLIDGLERKKHKVIPITVFWPQLPDPVYYKNLVKSQIGSRRIGTVIGHSWGALALAELATDWTKNGNPPDPLPNIIFCGQSARYPDDLKDHPARKIVEEMFGKIPPGFQNLDMESCAQAITTVWKAEDMTVIIGEEEEKRNNSQGKRARKTANLLGCELVVVSGAEHDFDDSQLYVDELVKRVR